VVKRARHVDAEPIAKLVAEATGGRIRPTEEDVIDRMGLRGFFVVTADRNLVGVVGWTAENLVARVEDYAVHPISMRPIAGRELLVEVENAARELECEAALLLVARGASIDVVTFYESCGYSFRPLAEMPDAWRESATEVVSDDRFVMVKQLRAELVSQPI
jgi:N-acetylglutamate synthase-like GNAT family acetyltransferase